MGIVNVRSSTIWGGLWDRLHTPRENVTEPILVKLSKGCLNRSGCICKMFGSRLAIRSWMAVQPVFLADPASCRNKVLVTWSRLTLTTQTLRSRQDHGYLREDEWMRSDASIDFILLCPRYVLVTVQLVLLTDNPWNGPSYFRMCVVACDIECSNAPCDI